jgi:REDY-like protein HapK
MTMPTLIVLFNLKAGVSANDYENWARNVDLPTVNGLKSVERFKVYRAQSVLGSSATPPYQYTEVLQVHDMGALFADIGTPAMQKVAAEFQNFADAPTFVVSEDIEA